MGKTIKLKKPIKSHCIVEAMEKANKNPLNS
jgi:hypothetical protein